MQSTRLRLTRAEGLARLLSLAGAGLFLGGFVALVLGVPGLGQAYPRFPGLLVFGATLMLLAPVPIAAGNLLARRSPPRLGAWSRTLITLAVIAAAVTAATAVVALVER